MANNILTGPHLGPPTGRSVPLSSRISASHSTCQPFMQPAVEFVMQSPVPLRSSRAVGGNTLAVHGEHVQPHHPAFKNESAPDRAGSTAAGTPQSASRPSAAKTAAAVRTACCRAGRPAGFTAAVQVEAFCLPTGK